MAWDITDSATDALDAEDIPESDRQSSRRDLPVGGGGSMERSDRRDAADAIPEDRTDGIDPASDVPRRELVGIKDPTPPPKDGSIDIASIMLK